MSTALTGQTIINKFNLYIGDQSELSTADELDLLNKVYDDTMNQRQWSFLKSSVAGTIDVTNGVATITPPEDFRYFCENSLKTDNSYTVSNNASPKVIFVGPSYAPYQIVNWSDRRQFRNISGYCYYDATIGKIVFTTVPPDLEYEFDYIRNWDDLTLATSPIFPADFHDMLYQAMCVDSVIINLFDKARSYAKENQAAYDDMYKKLCYYDSQFTLN